MIEAAGRELEYVAPLFAGTDETLVLSCLQGVMGRVWADKLPDPTAARLICGDFIMLAGDAASAQAEELVGEWGDGIVLKHKVIVPVTDDWESVIERVLGDTVQKYTRFQTRKDTVFSPEKLKSFTALPEGFELRRYDKELCRLALGEGWSDGALGCFEGAEDFLARGLGYAVMKGRELVSSATSYSCYNGGFEVEIDTKPEYRRRGLARACAAAFILECLERGLYPSWDAANGMSLALSKQLGYEPGHEYTAYLIR